MMEYSSQLLSDKVIEIGVVFTLVITVLHMLLQVFKIKSEQKIMMKIIEYDNDIQEFARLISVLNTEQKMRPIKWSIFFAALALAFIIIHFSKVLGIPQSDNFYLFIIFLLLSSSFLIYYLILRLKLKKKTYV